MFACYMLARQTLVQFGTLGAEIIGARQGKMGSDLARHRHDLNEKLKQTSGQTSAILLQLLAIASENPPGDTTLLAQEVSTILQSVPGIDVELVSAVHPIANVAAVIHGRAPGRRLVFNGHLDTFEIGDSSAWSTSPYGELKDGRIYGRGAADMKGGLAAQIYAALRLAEIRNCWQGELSLILTGDEETAGPYGTQYLLETSEVANGDAMMCADAGSPNVLRFGEKGLIWLTIEAAGKAGHGAHTHLTVSAIDRLLAAISALRSITEMPVKTNPRILSAIDDGASLSEVYSGQGETQTLKSITINFGTIKGGSTRNLVADHAEVTADIRLPIGVNLDGAKSEIASLIGSLPGIRYRVDSEAEATVTDPHHEIVTRTAAVCAEVLGQQPAVTMRVGASDAALYRARGIASVVCGLTPHNMGGADEHVLVAELTALGEIYTLAGFDYLTSDRPEPCMS
jgi:succinyl-diaminopimelate desuccinylase